MWPFFTITHFRVDPGGPDVIRRIVAVASGRESILGAGLRHDDLVRSQIVSLLADRECGALSLAQTHGIPTTRIDEQDNERFSDRLLAHCQEIEADYIVLFLNRLLAGPVLDHYERRIVNIHPSLLPAFKGLHAFEQALQTGARFWVRPYISLTST